MDRFFELLETDGVMALFALGMFAILLWRLP